MFTQRGGSSPSQISPWLQQYEGIAAVRGEGTALSHGLDAIGESALGMPAWGKGGWSKEYLLFRA